MKKYLFFITFYFQFISFFPQLQVPAYYEGYLFDTKDSIFLSLKIDTTRNKFVAFLTIPEQMVKNIKSLPFQYQDTVKISFATIKATFVAHIDQNRIEGFWQQSRKEIPLTLHFTPAKKAFRIKRPQQVLLDTVSYFVKPIQFSSHKNITLHGQIFLPDTISRHPVVMMVTGSGPQNMYEEIADHQPFLVIADFLVREGIAVLLYNERGVSPSTGDFSSATTYDFLHDALAGVRFLKRYSYADPRKIGIIGHSEGGLIAAIAAAKSKDLAFAISIGGVFIPAKYVIPHQLDKMLRYKNIPDSVRQAMVEYIELCTSSLLLSKNETQLQAALKGNYETIISKFSKEHIQTFHLDAFFQSTMIALTKPWTKAFIAINPSEYVARIKIPFLAIFGEKDTQVLPDENAEALTTHFNPKHKDLLTIKIFPNLNHLMQPCRNGLPEEYMSIDTTFSIKAMQYMSQWIKKYIEVRAVE